MNLYFSELTKDRIKKILEYYRSEVIRLRDVVYDNMKLQAEGVKYKPKSKDTTYYGRQAIHALSRLDHCNRSIVNYEKMLAEN